MKSYRIFLIFFIVVFLIGCAAQNKMRYGLFDFSYQGKNYKIESYTPPKGSGNNFLVLKKDKKIVFKAIDKEQNGYIDKILIGDISLKKAREIYSNGLQKCSESGNMETKTFKKSYTNEDIGNKYFIATYSLNSDEVYNKFTIIKKINMEINNELVFIDNLADGTLNQVIKGPVDINDYQDIYKKILERGVKFGEINKVEGKYWVVTNK
ncbi:MAG: hypothetical protein R6V04_17210 [bacterium]